MNIWKIDIKAIMPFILTPKKIKPLGASVTKHVQDLKRLTIIKC